MNAVRVRKIRARDAKPNSRLLLRVLAAVALAWGAFLILHLYHDSNADYQRAMANCIEDRNKTAAPSSGADASASAMACATSAAK